MSQVQVPPPPTMGEQHLRQSPTRARRPWWQKKRFAIPLGLVVLVMFVGALRDPAADEQQLATGEQESEAVVLVTIPDVSRMGQAEAGEALREAGLGRYIAVKQESDEPEGTVLGTNPPAGEEIEAGTRIELLVADLSAETKAAAAAEQEAEREEAERRADEERQAEEARKEQEAEREEAERRAEEERQAEEARKEEESTGTVGQENAVRSAEAYLDSMGFSRSGLIDQLEFEGYSTADATFAVDALNVDWKQQAARTAEAYLDSMGFSRSGLIDQLEFEGYSREQAEYGVTQVGL